MFSFFTDLDSKQLQNCSVEELIENLNHRKEQVGLNCDNHLPPIYEFLPENAITRYYYDVDLKHVDARASASETIRSLQRSEDLWEILEGAFCAALEIHPNDIISVAVANSEGKFSLHVVLRFTGSRDLIKKSTKLINNFLTQHGYPACIDEKVYKKNQKWRVLYTAKRNQQNVLIPIKGSIEDSLVTIFPSTCELILPVEALDTIQPQHTIHRVDEYFTCKLRWFHAALNHPGLGDLWRAKSSSYDAMVAVAQSLCIESNRSEQGLKLFAKFCLFNANEVNDLAYITQKYNSFSNCVKERFNELAKWVKDYNAKIADELKPIYNGKVNKIFYGLNFDLLPDFENYDHATTDIPYLNTNLEFILAMQIQHSVGIRSYWRHAIGQNGFEVLYGLLQAEIVGDKSIFEWYTERCNEAKRLFGYDVLYPYDVRPSELNHRVFFQWICENLDLPFPDMEVLEKTKFVLEECNDCVRFYLELATRIDPEATKLSVSYSYTRPLGRKEYVSPTQLLREIVLTEKLQYRFQHPFFKFLKKLFAESQVTAIATKNWQYFLLYLSHTNEEMEAERCFHFFTQPYDTGIVAKIILDLFPFFICDQFNQVFAYNDLLGLWDKEKDHIMGLFTRFATFLEAESTKGTASFNHAYNESSANSIINFIKRDEGLRATGYLRYEELKKTSVGKLLFMNGYYDGIQDVFNPCMDVTICGKNFTFFPHYDIMFFSKINNNYRALFVEEEIEVEELKAIYFTLLHGEEKGNYWLLILSMILFGIPMKRFMHMVGDTNAGKSTEVEMIQASFNSYIVKGASTAYFAVQKGDMRAAHRKLDFIPPNAHKRYMPCSEAQDKDMKINSELLKQLSSGGKDEIDASRLYENSRPFDISFVVGFYVNEPLKFDKVDTAVNAREDRLCWDKVCVDIVTDPLIQIKKDPRVDEFKNSKVKQLQYNHLIMTAFKTALAHGYQIAKPLSMKMVEAAEQATATSEELIEAFLQEVIITGNPEDTIKATELQKIITEEMKIANHERVKFAIQTTCTSLGVTITNDRIRDGGKQYRVWKGCMLRKDKAKTYTSLATWKQWKDAIQQNKGILSATVLQSYFHLDNLLVKENQLNAFEIQLIEKLATPEQKQYLAIRNSFYSHKK